MRDHTHDGDGGRYLLGSTALALLTCGDRDTARGEALLDAARRITVPIQFLLPWDDEHVERESALALFDAFGSAEKTLHANPGDHRGIRWIGVDNEFLARHLGRADSSAAKMISA